MKSYYWLLLFINLGSTVSSLQVIEVNSDGDNPGPPIILTPLIEEGKIEDAVQAASVYFNGFKTVKSYAGFLTVNKLFNSNLFFWFFPAAINYNESSVVLWLQGGPGQSSLIGVFQENGPYKVPRHKGLDVRQYSWTWDHSVLYIDNPVGSGFSFTNDEGYCQNQTQVATDLYEALQQFFLLFPDLQSRDFFIAGESYGGKYVPAISHMIHQKNLNNASLKINLKGLAIGNGVSDPEHQMNYSDYWYQIGLIDSNTKLLVQQQENEIVDLIQNHNYSEALNKFDHLLTGDLFNGSSFFRNVSGLNSLLNYVYESDPLDMDYMLKYIERNDVRAAIHAGDVPFGGQQASVVETNLSNDIMQSVAPWITELLSHYRVLIYNGQLDIVVPYPLTVNYLANLKFDGDKEYKSAERYQWHVDGELAGFVKQAGNLTEVLVRNAGHMVPMDQPKWALDLITRFVRNQSLH